MLVVSACVRRFFCWAMGLKWWECLHSRNPGWCCLYCSVSGFVLTQTQRTSYVLFSQTYMYDSLPVYLSPRPNWPPPICSPSSSSFGDPWFLTLIVNRGSVLIRPAKKQALLKPSDTPRATTDGIHSEWWVLVHRHVVCRRITGCLCCPSFWPACCV